MGVALYLWIVAGCGWFRPPPPDVWILSVDTLRVDHVSAYNPASPASTPNIDALAADGVRFTEAFSPVSVTGPAFASIMTGLNPASHGVFTNLFRGGEPLAVRHKTLAESFADAGYRTGAFVSAFTLRKALGLDRGFTVYNGGENRNRDGSETAASMGAWMSVQEGAVFGWFHTFDPHGPLARLLKPDELSRRWEEDPAHLRHFPSYQQIGLITQHDLYESLYARGVERADASVGMVVDALKALGRYDDALIVLLADHGEGFRERSLWFDHGTSAHVEQTHVPLVIKFPQNRRRGTVDARLVSLVDVAPTILDIASLPGHPFDGHSLTGAAPVRSYVESESSHCKRVDVLDCVPTGGQGKELAVRSLDFSAISQSTAAGEQLFAYDRQNNPAEIRPTQQPLPDELDSAMRALRSDRRAREYGPMPNANAADATSAKLRALGYLE